MKILPHKLLWFLILGTLFTINAQEKIHKEEFTVDADVIIDVNTRHSDIEIETWNRNKVVIEAFMIIEGEEITKEARDNFHKKWDFEATGNSKKIAVKSRTNSMINIYAFDFDDINYEDIEYPLANFSIGSLDVLDSLDFIEPPLPPAPPMFPAPPMPPLPNLPSEFDFEAYKKDKSYLERWKKENEDFIGKNAKVKTVGDFIVINSDDTNITMNDWKNKEEYLKSIVEEGKRYKEEYLKERKKHMEERKKSIIEMKKHLNEQNQKEKRIEIKKMLKERNKLKVKRLIKIKAPKNAKLNMNVKYGELSFTK